MKRWITAAAVLVAGLGLNVAALTLSDRHAAVFPSVPDVVVDHLPFVDLFAYGEIYLGLYLLTFVVVYFRQPGRNFPYLLTLVGIFYAWRALFLLTLPIGAPFGAIHADHRLSVYPFGDHSYFPSGHFGLMCLLGLNVQSRLARRVFIGAALVFGVGTMLTKAHYTADLVGGFLIAYATFAWGERSLKYQMLGPGKPLLAPDVQWAAERGARGPEPSDRGVPNISRRDA